MKSKSPMNMVVFIFAMIFSTAFLIIPLVCLWTMLDDLATGNVFLATLKLVVSVISALVGVFLAFITVRCLR